MKKIILTLIILILPLQVYSDSLPTDEPLPGSGQYAELDFTDIPGVVYFFNTWCPYCQNKMPEIKKLSSEYTQIKFVFVNRFYRETISEEEVIEYLKKYDIENADIIFDRDGLLTSDCLVKKVPTIILAEKGNTVKGIYEGEWDEAVLRSAIEELYNKKPKEFDYLMATFVTLLSIIFVSKRVG